MCGRVIVRRASTVFRTTSGSRRCRAARGFTLIELLVVMAIIATLTALVAPGYLKQGDRAKETVMRHNLTTLREALDDYRADHGRDPDSLQALVDGRYLRDVPLDPLTGKRTTWVIRQGDGGSVRDVRSGAKGRAVDGSAYDAW
ncbi:prepilin-type N-terminal cleavage/methylation domain-containing protein [Burkholderia metallica]|uniref:type II secretion system protein n=1 Tax=Burkholderia metallica TaxID=488729 RepID=UPI000D1BBEC1